jgi:hypothetical protein
MRNLERLNQLLLQHDLGLPAYRTAVDSSGRNLKFLRHTLKKKENVPQEITDLLQMKDKELFSKS